MGKGDDMSERNDLVARIAQVTNIHPEKVCEVVQLALEELHRIMIVDEKGPTAAVMEACFSFGGEAAFHLIGLFASEHAYHGRDDDAGMWSEVAIRFIPGAYAEGCDRIAPWFNEKTAGRLRLDAEIKKRASSTSKNDERDPDCPMPQHFDTLEAWEQHLTSLRALADNTTLKSEMIEYAEDVIARKQQGKPFSPAAALAMGRAAILAGLKHGDPQLARAGQELLNKTNAELDSQKGQTASPSELPSSPNDEALSRPVRDWDEDVLNAALENWPEPKAKP
jgi:hypothetical protein